MFHHTLFHCYYENTGKHGIYLLGLITTVYEKSSGIFYRRAWHEINKQIHVNIFFF